MNEQITDIIEENITSNDNHGITAAKLRETLLAMANAAPNLDALDLTAEIGFNVTGSGTSSVPEIYFQRNIEEVSHTVEQTDDGGSGSGTVSYTMVITLTLKQNVTKLLYRKNSGEVSTVNIMPKLAPVDGKYTYSLSFAIY